MSVVPEALIATADDDEPLVTAAPLTVTVEPGSDTVGFTVREVVVLLTKAV